MSDRGNRGMPPSRGGQRRDLSGGRARHAAPVARRRKRSKAPIVGGIIVVVVAAFAIALIGPWSPVSPFAPESSSGPDPLPPASDQPAPSEEELLARKIDETLSGMTLEQKVAQLFIVRPEAITGVGVAVSAGDATRDALASMPVGGLVYFADNLVDEQQTREMLANTRAYAEEVTGLPPFLCVDEEGGTVSRVGGNEGFSIANVGDMRDVGATGDDQRAYDVALTIGGYLTDLGFNVDFAPDADIANNPDSDTMALRSFGTSADVVSPMVAAQVRGFADAGILCAAKHFPGIGGAMGDSHDSQIYSEKTADDMAAEELKPFEAAIAEGVPFVMVGHLSCPAITGDNDPASVSPEIVTGLLRERLGYDGIVVTDSLGMGAVSGAPESEVGVLALEAGVDVLLMPADLEATYQGVLDAVASGRLSEDRIDESVRRVLAVKLGSLAD